MADEREIDRLFPRTRVYHQGDFVVDVDSRGRFFIFGPDGSNQEGMVIADVCRVHDAIRAAIEFWQDVGAGKKHLPK